jgi:hypothetical protein
MRVLMLSVCNGKEFGTKNMYILSFHKSYAPKNKPTLVWFYSY